MALEPERIVILQNSILVKVADLVRPWMPGQPPKPLVRIVNNTPQSLHLRISQQDNVMTVDAQTRVRDPGDEIMVIPPGDSRVIDPNGG